MLSEFMKNVKKEKGCWVWSGKKDKRGYGSFRYRGRLYSAHRFMYEFHYVEAPNYFVCHKCDNPSCVNPLHLFDGTAKDNWADSVVKGRTMKIVPKCDDYFYDYDF